MPAPLVDVAKLAIVVPAKVTVVWLMTIVCPFVKVAFAVEPWIVGQLFTQSAVPTFTQVPLVFL